jgi:hypothetical protein
LPESGVAAKKIRKASKRPETSMDQLLEFVWSSSGYHFLRKFSFVKVLLFVDSNNTDFFESCVFRRLLHIIPTFAKVGLLVDSNNTDSCVSLVFPSTQIIPTSAVQFFRLLKNALLTFMSLSYSHTKYNNYGTKAHRCNVYRPKTFNFGGIRTFEFLFLMRTRLTLSSGFVCAQNRLLRFSRCPMTCWDRIEETFLGPMLCLFFFRPKILAKKWLLVFAKKIIICPLGFEVIPWRWNSLFAPPFF